MIALSDDARNARLQVVVDGMAGGTLTLYTAPQPETGAAITTQTALIVITLPAIIPMVAHTATLTILAQIITATGTAVWGRIMSSSDVFVLDGDCGIVSSNALFRLKTTALKSDSYLSTVVATVSE